MCLELFFFYDNGDSISKVKESNMTQKGFNKVKNLYKKSN